MTRPICASCVEVEHGLQPVTHIRRGPGNAKVKVTVLMCAACREFEEARKKRQPVSVSQKQRAPSYNNRRKVVV